MEEKNESMTISAENRTETRKAVRALRKEGKLPAVLYGHGVKNKVLVIDARDFETVYKAKAGSSLIDLKTDDQKPVKVIIQDVQRDAVSGVIEHVDFHQVRMTEKISAEVELNFVGVSKAVKESGGVLVKSFNTLKIECLPQDLVHVIDVDISALETFDDNVRVSDVSLPQGITVKANADEVVVGVQAPRSEEELKALEETPEESSEGEPEVVGEEGKEGEADDEQKPDEAKEGTAAGEEKQDDAKDKKGKDK